MRPPSTFNCYFFLFRPNVPVIYHCTGSFNPSIKIIQRNPPSFYKKYYNLVCDYCKIWDNKFNSENLYTPYVKESFRYEDNNFNKLRKIMSEEDKKIFNIDKKQLNCYKFSKILKAEKDYSFLLKKYHIFLKILIFLVWKKWILKSTPATHLLFTSSLLIYGLLKAGKGFKKIQHFI